MIRWIALAAKLTASLVYRRRFWNYLLERTHMCKNFRLWSSDINWNKVNWKLFLIIKSRRQIHPGKIMFTTIFHKALLIRQYRVNTLLCSVWNTHTLKSSSQSKSESHKLSPPSYQHHDQWRSSWQPPLAIHSDHAFDNNYDPSVCQTQPLHFPYHK